MLLRDWEERDTENGRDKMPLGRDLQKFPGLQQSVCSGLMSTSAASVPPPLSPAPPASPASHPTCHRSSWQSSVPPSCHQLLLAVPT